MLNRSVSQLFFVLISLCGHRVRVYIYIYLSSYSIYCIATLFNPSQQSHLYKLSIIIALYFLKLYPAYKAMYGLFDLKNQVKVLHATTQESKS